jgi:hypothetical protein
VARHDRNPRGGKPRTANKRPNKDKRARQIAAREHERRRVEALEATRLEQQRLEARIAREAVEPAIGPALGASYVEKPVLPVQRSRRRSLGRLPAFDAEGTRCGLGQARQLVRSGYHVCHVMWLTGWGLKWLDDLPLDKDGYGLPL